MLSSASEAMGSYLVCSRVLGVELVNTQTLLLRKGFGD